MRTRALPVAIGMTILTTSILTITMHTPENRAEAFPGVLEEASRIASNERLNTDAMAESTTIWKSDELRAADMKALSDEDVRDRSHCDRHESIVRPDRNFFISVEYLL
jgi:hypothetical protein